ncbi:ATP-binding response regulator [Polaribacter porphyrae]|uniref:histidine kinase n=1 Tax=Polaribacter porphyrae TaxID=1137780 RepID=A0A2S7WMJ3_9FLAO|nr:ATP-binding protein [Polaribacter porphyrae]PQJ78799.1 hypothetical protein BTO18_06200 [Polaribacter porphyrae]
MISSKINHFFIEVATDYSGNVKEIVAGKFVKKEFVINTSIFTVCPFLEGTLEALPIKEPFLIEGMLIISSDKEYNVDIELFKDNDFVSVLIHNRTNVYKFVDQLNQSRNDLFFLKREIDEKNKELKRLREIADKANESKSRFLAMMSHEVRNPLNVILNYTDLIKKENLSEKVINYVKYLTISGKNLKVIVDDILDLSRVEAGKLELANEPISLQNIIEQLRNNYNASHTNKEIELFFNTSKDIPEFVFGDDVRIYQVLTNLINNSIKFTPKGFVKTEISVIKKEKNKVEILFKISDSGRGMTKVQASKIFEEYQQNKLSDSRIHKGAGLGLSIVKRLVTAMQGNVSVESKVNEGTTFLVEIPFLIDTQNTFRKKEKIEKLEGNFIKGKKILVADDNFLNLKIVEHILKKEEANYLFTRDGVEALLAMKKENFDLVLLDINMPNLSGEELIKQKKTFDNNNSRTPFVAMTANNTKEDIESYFSIGFDAVIPKPFTPKQFIDKLNNILSKSVKS